MPNFVSIAAALKVHPADLFLRNASSTVASTKEILRVRPYSKYFLLISKYSSFLLSS